MRTNVRRVRHPELMRPYVTIIDVEFLTLKKETNFRDFDVLLRAVRFSYAKLYKINLLRANNSKYLCKLFPANERRKDSR